ncbi:MAG: tryptophan-rich sensory protein [Bacteroidetes bacterium]|nr:tryptophan-rich sensory protein [Bacteroidota bacterium]
MLSKNIQYILLFIVLNFGALAIGSYFMNSGPSSDWYLTLKKAPWTPPGWVFGVAWFSIMICYSIYMANLILISEFKFFIWIVFSIQFILNISWNYFFFNQHLTMLGFLNIGLLTIVVGYFLFNFSGTMRLSTLWIAPYFVWLLLASSLNLYIVIKN